MGKNKFLGKSGFLFVVGLVTVTLLAIPCILLGEDAIFTYHDQLDGELIAYILQAKHLWDGNFLPEFLGGASKTALTPPAPGCVLLFRVFTPLTALIIMQLVGSLVGYVGMYLLCRKVTGSDVAALIAGGFYAALPFLPVYGLSQFGLPMLLWCVLRVREDDGPDGRQSEKQDDGKNERKKGWHNEQQDVKNYKGQRTWQNEKHINKKNERINTWIWASLYAVIYALNSSLVLVGFAVLMVLALWILWEFVRGKKEKRYGSSLRMGMLWFCMTFIYFLTNLSLIGQMLGIGDATVSHKTEYVLGAEGFLSGWWNALLHGGQHSEDYHLVFMWLAVAVMLVGYLGARRLRSMDYEDMQQNVDYADVNQSVDCENVRQPRVSFMDVQRAGGIALVCNVCLAGVSACWNSGLMVAMRGEMGALKAFQLDRLLWLCPCLWYLILGCTVACVLRLLKEQKRIAKAAGVLGCALTVICLGVTGLWIIRNSDMKANLQKLRDEDYRALSYSDYYALGVMDQVQDFLWEYTGEKPSEYRVVSLGIDPAAALYHGFYCLDGYSNNYSLEYKHQFRRVIAPALSESEYLRDYYDDWGNRCYVFGTESPGYYTIEKGGFYFQHLECDTEALRELGGDYLFSAAYIANSEELGLELLREEAFETEVSYYRIFVYEVWDSEGDKGTTTNNVQLEINFIK